MPLTVTPGDGLVTVAWAGNAITIPVNLISKDPVTRYKKETRHKEDEEWPSGLHESYLAFLRRSESVELFIGVGLRDSVDFIAACAESGYNKDEHGTRVCYWLADYVAQQLEETAVS